MEKQEENKEYTREEFLKVIEDGLDDLEKGRVYEL